MNISDYTWGFFGYAVGMLVAYFIANYEIREAVRRTSTIYFGFWFDGNKLQINVHGTLESVKSDSQITSWARFTNTGEPQPAKQLNVRLIDGKAVIE